MSCSVAGIECKYYGQCTDRGSKKCSTCENNTSKTRNTRGSYYKPIVPNMK